jgi:hypothetical protein
MASMEDDQLLSLLFDEQSGRKLVNIKFFEGSACPDGAALRAAAFAALSKAYKSSGVWTDMPPESPRAQRPVSEFLAEI